MPDGTRRQFSTGKEDPDEAKAIADETERAARRGTEKPAQLRQALSRIAETFSPAQETNPADWIVKWAEQKRPEVSASTYESYANTATEIADYFRRHEIDSFYRITTQAIIEMRNEWAAKNSTRTANGKIKHLRIALKSARIAKLIDDDPSEGVAALRCTDTVRREFSQAELEMLLPTLTPQWRALVLLGLYTGQRLNDLTGLTWKQVDLTGGTITFKTKKTGSLVNLPLLQPVIDALLALPSSDSFNAPIFPNMTKISKAARSNAFRRCLARVGLADSVTKYKKNRGQHSTKRSTSELSFHSLRHTATTMLKSAGVSDAIARAIIGHQSAAVSQKYTHIDLDTMKKAMERMNVL